MVAFPDRSRNLTLRDLALTLVDGTAAAEQRGRLGRLLPRLDQTALSRLAPADRALARSGLAEALLVAVGPDAARAALDRATDDAEVIEDAAARALALAAAADGAAALGSLGADGLARVEALAGALPPIGARARLFAVLAVSYQRTRQAEKASKMINRALNSAEKQDSAIDRVEALCSVAEVLHSGAVAASAAEALARATSIAGAIDEPAAQARALLLTATAYGRLGRAEAALELVERAVGLDPEQAAAPESVSEFAMIGDAADIDIESLESLDDLEELDAPAAAPAPRPAVEALRPAPAAEIPAPAMKDPCAGIKFPARRSSRRR